MMRLRIPVLILSVALFVLSGTVRGQQVGPLPPPPASSRSNTSAAAPGDKQPPVTTRASAAAEIDTSAPSKPVEEIIKAFAAHESQFRTERDNYTYTQTFVIQTIDADGQPDGEQRMTSDILFTPDGKRTEHVTNAPASSLQRLSLTQQDMDDLEHVQPFVLTTEELPKYDVKYVGKQELDDVSTYVFDVGPKKIEKNQRYFQGRVWVEDKDFGIVKTDGKAVPDIKKHGTENVFPRFETFRENIEGNYWFPTYTRSNDTLHFATGDIRIRMTVRYSNYKRFGVSIKIGAPVENKPQ